MIMGTLIIGDSLVKYLHHHLDSNSVKIVSYPGITIPRLTQRVEPESVQGYRNIILHVGTNDIGYQFPAEIAASYHELIEKVKLFNPR